jgi:hypothetical protein
VQECIREYYKASSLPCPCGSLSFCQEFNYPPNVARERGQRGGRPNSSSTGAEKGGKEHKANERKKWFLESLAALI